MTSQTPQAPETSETQGPVLVVGGTGKTGRRVVARLRERGVETRAASRSGDTPFDWQDRATWQAALAGAAAVYIVPQDASPSPTPAFVEQAVASGVRRIVLLSARGTGTPGYFGPGHDDGGPHGEGERAVRASGVPWTILRPGWFAQNFNEGAFLGGVRGGTLALPTGDGRAAFVDADDIADVAVAALTEDGHTGEVYELSGRRALSIAEALDEIAKETGVRATHVTIDESTFRDGLLSQGVPEAEAELWTVVLRPIAASREAPVLDGVRRALGREPRDFTDFVRDAAAKGSWA
ncbi:NAD(P)-dependent oxidoreductase [Streptomyces sp. WZ.A104]|uniref:NAD(P)H-binding protein n=1 Tax=Streptomyces durocortorensis TaxID=2811104 RepID=A0ABY9W170_9ACTN|nr:MULTISPECIES: NAD(P)H-binding protein [Streptomyces]PCG84863.1 NAD(P)-dependent oxidoreductase [Streptomyces sp. WZ.A104]WNF28806.1 NAD(P)H-binding protein [Streptomyces durocortorensis]